MHTRQNVERLSVLVRSDRRLTFRILTINELGKETIPQIARHNFNNAQALCKACSKSADSGAKRVATVDLRGLCLTNSE